MKRKTIALTAIVLLLCFFTGCSSKREKEARSLAEDYLTSLKDMVSEETLRLSDDKASQFGDLYAFTAFSEKYGDSFIINVNANDTVTDSYFAISLKNAACSDFSKLIKSLSFENEPHFDITVNKNIVSSALSGHNFNSIEEANDAIKDTSIASVMSMGFVQVGISSDIPDSRLAELLHAMQNAGFFADLSISGDVRVFHVSEDSVNYTRTDDPSGDEIHIYEFQ